MKTILLLLAACFFAPAQTIITGPLYDASGALATCQVTMRPVNVPGFAPAAISYAIVAGDLSGVTGGYGKGVTGITRFAPLQLEAGTYSVNIQCSGVVSSTQSAMWVISGSSVTIQSLLGYVVAGRTWSQMSGAWSGTSGTWAAQ